MAVAKRNYSIVSYLDRLAQELTPQLAFSVTTRKDWQKWRDILRAKLMEMMTIYPVRNCALDAETLEVTDQGDHIREKVVYESELGVSVPAYVLVPKGVKTPYRTLLCLHGHGRGKDDVVGIADNERDRAHVRQLNYDYGLQFVRRGYLVIAPDARAFGERVEPSDHRPDSSWQSSCLRSSHNGLLLGRDLMGTRVWDVMRTIDYLRTRGDADLGSLGCVGLSQGGCLTMFSAALDDRIKVAVISGFFNSFKVAMMRSGHCCCHYTTPGLLCYAEMADIAALIAPRPLLIENGRQDPNFPVDVAISEFQRVRQAYELLGVPEKVDMDAFDGGHQFSGRKAFDWVDRWLEGPR